MKKISDRLFDWMLHKNPWLFPFWGLVIGLGNAYEAAYKHGHSLMSIVEWAFAALGFVIFVASLPYVISHYRSKDRD
jgi:uncharacterized membrane protein YjfL (UPF0719 family)